MGPTCIWLFRLFGFSLFELLGLALEPLPPWWSLHGPQRMGYWSLSSQQAFGSKIRLQRRNEGWEQVPVLVLSSFSEMRDGR